MKKWTWTLETWQNDSINRSTHGIEALMNHAIHRYTHVMCSAGRFHQSAILHLMTLWHKSKTLARSYNVHSVLCDGIDGWSLWVYFHEPCVTLSTDCTQMSMSFLQNRHFPTFTYIFITRYIVSIIVYLVNGEYFRLVCDSYRFRSHKGEFLTLNQPFSKEKAFFLLFKENKVSSSKWTSPIYYWSDELLI